MAETHSAATRRAKTPRGTRTRAPAEGSCEAGTLGANDRVADALIAFIEDRTGFESSAAHDRIAADIRASPNFNEAVLVPIKHKMLSFENAVLFGFFLFQTEKELEKTEPEWLATVARFNLAEYYMRVAAVYDRAMDSTVYDYLEDDEGTDSESDGDESDQ